MGSLDASVLLKHTQTHLLDLLGCKAAQHIGQPGSHPQNGRGLLGVIQQRMLNDGKGHTSRQTGTLQTTARGRQGGL